MITPSSWFERLRSALRGALTRKSFLIALVLFVALGLMSWRAPTSIDVQIAASRFGMVIGGEEGQLTRLLDALDFQSLAVQNYSMVRLYPRSARMADPERYDLENDRFPSSAWVELDISSPRVAFEPAGETPSLTIEPGKPDASVGIQPLWVDGGSKVEMELTAVPSRSLTIRLVGAPVKLFVRVSGPIEMISEQGSVTGMDAGPFPRVGSSSYRFVLKEQVIEVVGGDEPLVLRLELRSEPGSLFSGGALPIQAIDVTRQGTLGERTSALVASGTIGYSDYPSIPAVQFQGPEFLELGDFRNFYVTSLGSDPGQPGLELLAEGVAGHVRTGMPGASKDNRLSRFDNLWHSQSLRQLFSVWKSVK